MVANRKSQALSLLEVMLAFGVLSVALLGVIALFTNGLRLMSHSKQLTAATEVGRQVLESVKTAGYSSIPGTDIVFDGRGATPDPQILGPPDFPPRPYPTEVVDGGNYEVVVRVTTPPASPTLRAVEVEVYYARGGSSVLQTLFHP